MNDKQKLSIFSMVIFLLSACSNPVGLDHTDDVVVLGVVNLIQDQVPVDGGVTIHLQLDDGTREVLLFRSLFTLPPPSQERQALYEIIAKLNVGDSIRAIGQRVEGGIEFDRLEIL